MTPIILFAAGLAVGATVSGIIVHFIKSKKHKKEVEDIYAQTSKELSEMKFELDEFHRVFVTSQRPEIAGEREELWKQVASDIKKGRKKVAEERSNPSNDILDKDDGITARRPEKERTDYRAIASPGDYISQDEETAEGNRNIIRKEASNGIIEIEEFEMRENNWNFNQKDLYFYENSTDLYTDDETLIESDEVPLYLGYSSEELAVRFLHYDEPQYIYVLNPEYETIYTVYVCQGRGPE